ncbi:MAG: class III poly(R)-hydroxyalkanoic acid synthase subunit PhaC [Chloroflexi bacterium]|nr:class III poly(R)-hydroxyalkanoic acid synthase subunit PhaC [Chloroflexota bacterium]
MFNISPETLTEDMLKMNQQIMDAVRALSDIDKEQIQIGPSEKEAVWKQDHVVLYRYKPLVEDVLEIPLLISYALVNRPYMVDLQEDRSLVRNLLNLGIDVYLIDWGYPKRNDRWLELDDYINGYLGGAVEYIKKAHDIDRINLLGICQGGVFSMCYTALHPENIKNLITMVAPVDFHVEDGLLNRWMGCGTGIPTIDPDLMVDALGNVPGDFMNFGFLMLKPFELGIQKYLGLLDIANDNRQSANFLRMEKWIFDSPDQAGAAWADFMQQFYVENRLVKGTVEIDGEVVDLKNITMPVLNLYAEQDHLVPPSSTKRLREFVGTDDFTEASFPVGHIGMYVSGKVQATLPPTIANWLKERA